MAITTQPSAIAVSGVALVTQPVIAVEDASGAVVKADTSTVTAALVGGTVGSSITNNTKAAVAGVATFSGLAINATPGSYSIIFTDGIIDVGDVTHCNRLPAVRPRSSIIATQPSATAAAGAALAIQPVVDIDDSGGAVIPSNTSTVTATLTSGSGTVAHNTAVAVAGVATFVGLTLDTPTGAVHLDLHRWDH